MNTKSEKNIYENKLQMKAVRFCTDIFDWGEDLTDKKLIIYPQKLKYIDDYISKKDRLKACGVVLINPEYSDPVHLVTATVDIESGDLYIHESSFNSMWKYLRNSINSGKKCLGRIRGSVQFPNLRKSLYRIIFKDRDFQRYCETVY